MRKLLMILMAVPMTVFGVIVAKHSESVDDVMWY